MPPSTPLVRVHKVLRSGVLTGIFLSLLGVAYSIYRYPRILGPPGVPVFLTMFVVGVLCYGFAASAGRKQQPPMSSSSFAMVPGGVLRLVWLGQ
jgi:hypothetical protein